MGKIRRRPSGTPRLRTPNWSPQEKQFLLQLIKERRDVVTTTSGYTQEKVTAWREILRQLGEKYGDKFALSSIKKVKTQWQNMRRIARDEITSFGPNLDKYSLQSLEVCHVLGLVRDGALVEDVQNFDSFNTSFVKIKTERLDDEETHAYNHNQLSVSGMTNIQEYQNLANDPSTSSMSEQYSDDEGEETPPEPPRAKKDVSAMTDPIAAMASPGMPHIGLLHRDMQEFLRYTAIQKQLKMESMKEERQVMRAMRDTAELNKIIAEQKLKHVLWVKKQEMTMYSGEPGSGAGKGGGGGGSIRSAGGSFGKREAAKEDEFFYRKTKEQIQDLKGHLNKEIAFHQQQIKHHEDAIRRHQDQVSNIKD